jgi:nicotinamidase-related amidase
MPEPLMIVDVQVGFLNPFTRHLPERIVRLIERGDYSPVLFTRFVNVPESPYWRFLNWRDLSDQEHTEIAPELTRFVQPELIFTKPGYAGMSDELAAYLRDSGYEQITLCGIDTDMCVLKIAMDVFDLGIRPIILVDCCASTSGLQSHLAGLAVLARNIGADQLRDAGLSEGRLGAPTFIDDATEQEETEATTHVVRTS